MCVAITVIGTDETIDTQGELALLVGQPEDLIFAYGEYDPTACLCPVDVERSLQRAGYEVRSGWDDAGCDFIAERRRRPGGTRSG